MRFDFSLTGDVARLCRKTEQEYFKKAHVSSTDPHKHIHREWIRDVVHVFAGKTFLTPAQSWQAIRNGYFDLVRNTHQNHLNKTPSKIKVLGRDQENPLWAEYSKIMKLEIPDYVAWMRREFDRAISIQHPLKKINTRGHSEMDRATEHRIAQKIFQHQDETRQAHLERLNVALRKAIEEGPAQIESNLMKMFSQ